VLYYFVLGVFFERPHNNNTESIYSIRTRLRKINLYIFLLIQPHKFYVYNIDLRFV
jgi:hypothetical protein